MVADRKTLDLTSQQATEDWLAKTKPSAGFLAAGLFGGIHANSAYPAKFIADNLAIALNVIRGAHLAELYSFVEVYAAFAGRFR